MQLQSTALRGVTIITPEVYADERGWFKESFSLHRYEEALGQRLNFVQDNISHSKAGVLRGLHYQQQQPQGKLITVLQGRILDVVADINPTSPTYGQFVSVELDADSHQQLWVPPGYAHGFCVLSEEARVLYKCTDYYKPSDEAGVRWDCPVLNIPWPIAEPLLSAKDQAWPTLQPLDID